MLLKEIVKYNEKQLEEVNGEQDRAKNLIVFEFNGVDIYNPFLDETMRFEVQPSQHYGISNINKMIKQYKKLQQK